MPLDASGYEPMKVKWQVTWAAWVASLSRDGSTQVAYTGLSNVKTLIRLSISGVTVCSSDSVSWVSFQTISLDSQQIQHGFFTDRWACPRTSSSKAGFPVQNSLKVGLPVHELQRHSGDRMLYITWLEPFYIFTSCIFLEIDYTKRQRAMNQSVWIKVEVRWKQEKVRNASE